MDSGLKKIVFLIGASGAGKTTVTKQLAQRNIPHFKILYFDSIEVPTMQQMEEQYGGPEHWQKIKTMEWIDTIHSQYLPHTQVLFDGQMRPSFIKEACQKKRIKNFEIILFDCSDAERKKRLIERGHEGLADDNMMNWARYLRRECQARGYPSLDTTSISVEEATGWLLTHLTVPDAKST